MVVEYILLLSLSAILLAGSFGIGPNAGGPVEMFQTKSPYLAKHIEDHLVTGHAGEPDDKKKNGFRMRWEN